MERESPSLFRTSGSFGNNTTHLPVESRIVMAAKWVSHFTESGKQLNNLNFNTKFFQKIQRTGNLKHFRSIQYKLLNYMEYSPKKHAFWTCYTYGKLNQIMGQKILEARLMTPKVLNRKLSLKSSTHKTHRNEQ